MMLYVFRHGHCREGEVAGENLQAEEDSWDWPCSDSRDVILWGRGTAGELARRAEYAITCAECILRWLRSGAFR
jgi:hypothetical protein